MQHVVNKLVRQFQVIDRERMQGLPFYNANLHVEALGFEEIEDGYIGALITPWFINLMLLFKQQPHNDVVIGRKVSHALPSGEYDFMVGDDDEIGRYDFISLASPVSIYQTQQQAQAFVMQKLRNYLAPAGEEQVDEHPLVFIEKPERGLSRRDFLRGPALTKK
jgi:[NiFe] hydrogenase assembly HybE family chaperone